MKKGLWSIMKEQEGSTSTTTRSATKSAQNITKDEQALGIITTSLHDNYVHFVDECQTAQHAWKILEKNFGAKSKKSVIGLTWKMYKLKMTANEDISNLVNRLESIVTQLTYIKCEIPESDRVAVLLGALPEAYENIVTIIEEKEPEPPITRAKAARLYTRHSSSFSRPSLPPNSPPHQ